MRELVNRYGQLLTALGHSLGAPAEERVTPETIERLTLPRLNAMSGSIQLLFISGPTAVGKSTVQRALEERGLRRCPNIYTRALRSEERPGDVIQMSEEEFAQAVRSGRFLYHRDRQGAGHGILTESVEALIASGKPFFMERSPPSLAKVLEHPLMERVRSAAAFILPPDPDTLIRRLERRAGEGDLDVPPTDRLALALDEFPHSAGPYHGFLVNDDVERVVAILLGLFPQAV